MTVNEDTQWRLVAALTGIQAVAYRLHVLDLEAAQAIEAHVDAALAAVREWPSDRPSPCVMMFEPPMDFAYCESHDTTFPLGEVCEWQGVESVAEHLQGKLDAMRERAVMAEVLLETRPAALPPESHVAADSNYPLPWTFVQWKGTVACLDVTCVCEHLNHYDGMSARRVRCGNCGRVWQLGDCVTATEMPPGDPVEVLEPNPVEVLGADGG